MRVSVAAAASPAELQQMLAAKERELAAMFESGRPMPQVCVLNRQGRVCVCGLHGTCSDDNGFGTVFSQRGPQNNPLLGQRGGQHGVG